VPVLHAKCSALAQPYGPRHKRRKTSVRSIAIQGSRRKIRSGVVTALDGTQAVSGMNAPFAEYGDRDNVLGITAGHQQHADHAVSKPNQATRETTPDRLHTVEAGHIEAFDGLFVSTALNSSGYPYQGAGRPQRAHTGTSERSPWSKRNDEPKQGSDGAGALTGTRVSASPNRSGGRSEAQRSGRSERSNSVRTGLTRVRAFSSKRIARVG
jgi:hypothetical protein